MRGNSHARCGAGEKPEEIECGQRPHSNTKGLPIAIVPGGDPGGLERLAVPAEPECALHCHHPGQRLINYCRQGGDGGGHDRKCQEKPPLFRPETPSAGEDIMIFETISNVLFPPKCVLCGELLDKHETDICRSCRVESSECHSGREKLSFLDSWAAVWYYEGYIRSSLLRFKFHRARHYAPVYGRVLAMRLSEEHPEGFDVLTWVPIGPLRKLKRGYDQVELLAKAVGEELGMEPLRMLRKVRNNPPQSGITGEAERKANVLGAYRVVNPEAFQGKRVLLLDDIITTGATAGECARMLLTAGAKEVHCGAVAAARHH